MEHSRAHGSCGPAGSFGYERGEHYEVSIKAGEQVLLPAVRDAIHFGDRRPD